MVWIDDDPTLGTIVDDADTRICSFDPQGVVGVLSPVVGAAQIGDDDETASLSNHRLPHLDNQVGARIKGLVGWYCCHGQRQSITGRDKVGHAQVLEAGRVVAVFILNGARIIATAGIGVGDLEHLAIDNRRVQAELDRLAVHQHRRHRQIGDGGAPELHPEGRRVCGGFRQQIAVGEHDRAAIATDGGSAHNGARGIDPDRLGRGTDAGRTREAQGPNLY